MSSKVSMAGKRCNVSNEAKANDDEALNLYKYFIRADGMKTAYENFLDLSRMAL